MSNLGTRRQLMVACTASLPLYWVLHSLNSQVEASLINVGLTFMALCVPLLFALAMLGRQRSGLHTFALVIACIVAVVCLGAIAIEVFGYLLVGEGRTLDWWFVLPWVLGLALSWKTASTAMAIQGQRRYS